MPPRSSLRGLDTSRYGRPPRAKSDSYQPNSPYTQDRIAGPTYESQSPTGGPMLSSAISGSSLAGFRQPKVTSPYAAKAFDPVAPVDTSAAHSAAYGAAKDDAAQTARASLTGLTAELGARGLKGGGYEGGAIGQTLAREANTIGAASRAQAESEFQANQRNAELNAQMLMNQRGQDMDWQSTLLGQDVAQRGQDIGAASTDYQGQIAQRGQDYGARGSWDALQAGLRQAGYQGAISQRGQDYGADSDFFDRLARGDQANLSAGLQVRGQNMGADEGDANREDARQERQLRAFLASMGRY